jgi:hypothetical protein
MPTALGQWSADEEGCILSRVAAFFFESFFRLTTVRWFRCRRVGRSCSARLIVTWAANAASDINSPQNRTIEVGNQRARQDSLAEAANPLAKTFRIDEFQL